MKNNRKITSEKVWVVLFVFAFLCVPVTSYLVLYWGIAKPIEPPPLSQNKINPTKVSNNKPNNLEDNFLPHKTEEEAAAKVAIVIDDLGHNIDIANKLLQFDVPISFSILPGLRYSRLIANQANKLNRDILLHLPMEPRSYPMEDPGFGALISWMDPQELEGQLMDNLDAVPHLVGINNHMGSKLTEDKKIMSIVMKKIKERNLFFLDSLTSSRTVAYKTAKEYGVKAAKRNYFLDHVNGVENINKQIIKLGEKALTNGYAIGIGHPYENTLVALKQSLPKLTEQGIIIVPVSQLVK